MLLSAHGMIRLVAVFALDARADVLLAQVALQFVEALTVAQASEKKTMSMYGGGGERMQSETVNMELQ